MTFNVKFIGGFIFWLFLYSGLFAQVGKPFPAISGETLDDKPMQLPSHAKGKFTIIGVAYSQKAQDDLKSWMEPVYYEFIDQNNLSSMVYDVNVYLVMMFTGSKKVIYGSAKKKIKNGTGEKWYKYTFLYKGELKDYQEKLNLPDKDIPAFYVLDKGGKVIHVEEGRYTSKKFDKITSLVEK